MSTTKKEISQRSKTYNGIHVPITQWKDYTATRSNESVMLRVSAVDKTYCTKEQCLMIDWLFLLKL